MSYRVNGEKLSDNDENNTAVASAGSNDKFVNVRAAIFIVELDDNDDGLHIMFTHGRDGCRLYSRQKHGSRALSTHVRIYHLLFHDLLLHPPVFHHTVCSVMTTRAHSRRSLNLPGAAKQSSPLKFFAVFSATVWNFNFKLHIFIF